VRATDPNPISFLQSGANSEARNTGFTIPSITTSYGGGVRPQESVYDIGAFEFGVAGAVTPTAPSNLRIIR
jgi:hypothetical protein